VDVKVVGSKSQLVYRPRPAVDVEGKLWESVSNTAP
jgi:hypothetical protein